MFCKTKDLGCHFHSQEKSTMNILHKTKVNIDKITRSVHGMFNCITVNFDRTQDDIYGYRFH